MAGYTFNDVKKITGVDLEASTLTNILKEIDYKGEHTYVAGGSVVRTLIGGNPLKGDIDIFSAHATEFKTAKKYFEKYELVSETKFSDSYMMKYGSQKVKIQLIKHRFCPLAEHFVNFDFHHCMVGVNLNPHQTVLYANPLTLPAIMGRKLVVNSTATSAYSLTRLLKYKKMGFTDCDTALEELINALPRNADGSGGYETMLSLGNEDIESTPETASAGLEAAKVGKFSLKDRATIKETLERKIEASRKSKGHYLSVEEAFDEGDEFGLMFCKFKNV